MKGLIVDKINTEKWDSAFKALYFQYWKQLYCFSYRFLQDDDESRDIVQETFTRLFLFLQGEKNLSDPKAWLYKVTTNLCLNLLKKTRKTRDILTTHQHMTEVNNNCSHTLNSEEKALKEEKDKIFQQIFLSLNAKDQLLLNLKWENFSYTEIADILGLKIDSIGKKLYRIHHKLAEKIKNGGFHEMPK